MQRVSASILTRNDEDPRELVETCTCDTEEESLPVAGFLNHDPITCVKSFVNTHLSVNLNEFLIGFVGFMQTVQDVSGFLVTIFH